MKKISFIILLLGMLFTACDKESLKLENPNEPGLSALTTEVGIQKAALGIYNPMRFYHDGSTSFYFTWFTQANHNTMGDVTAISAGNFNWRYVNQVASITLSDGTKITPTQGGIQPVMLKQVNTRDMGNENSFTHEWIPMYGAIGHANLMLNLLDKVVWTGSDAEKETKKKTYQAWFLWWKGFAYSRIGSIYSKGIIVNEYKQKVTTYVSHEDIIAEAKRNFEEAKKTLAGIEETNTTYQTLMTSFIPSSFRKGHGGFISPRMFERNINTYLARNILVNKYAKELTPAELAEIEKLAGEGIKETDKIFNIRSDANEDACFVFQTTWSSYRMLVGWENVSERLIQDFKEGDDRFTRNFTKMAVPVYNPRGRGLSYGTRYGVVDGGDYASSTPGAVEIPMACSYEENELMLAEAKIRKGQIDAGLAHIDAVRKYQNAKLQPIANTGLDEPAALEELRRERRVGLFLKGTPFYDARRWGILKPVSEGGGRKNAIVVIKSDGTVDKTTIDYNYMEWWDIPTWETDFNPMTN